MVFTARMAKPIPLEDRAVLKLHDQVLRHLFTGKSLSEPRSLGPAWKGVKTLRQSEEAWESPARLLEGLNLSLLPDKFNAVNVQGSPVQVNVALAWRHAPSSARKFVVGGNVKASHSSKSARGVPVLLTIRFNSNRSVNDFLREMPRVQKELLSVLRHEVTHLRDLLPHYEPTEDVETYYNRPVEVRAYMRQVVDEVLAEMHEDAKESEGWIDTSWDSAERYLEKSFTWERVRKVLSPKNKKAILKSVAQGMQYAYPKLRERYYVPWNEASKLASRYLRGLDLLKTRQ